MYKPFSSTLLLQFATSSTMGFSSDDLFRGYGGGYGFPYGGYGFPYGGYGGGYGYPYHGYGYGWY